MFFEGMNELMQEGQTINLNLLKRGGRLYACMIPRTDKMPEAARDKLIPLILSGTPRELDEGFLPAIGEPVRERFGLLGNADAFRENTRTAVSKKAQDSNKVSVVENDSKPSKEDQKMAEAEAHEKARRWPEAYAIYKKLSDASPGNRKLKEKAAGIWEKMAQRPLFDFGDGLNAEVVGSPETDKKDMAGGDAVIYPEDDEADYDEEDDTPGDGMEEPDGEEDGAGTAPSRGYGSGEEKAGYQPAVSAGAAIPVQDIKPVQPAPVHAESPKPEDMFARVMALANSMD